MRQSELQEVSLLKQSIYRIRQQINGDLNTLEARLEALVPTKASSIRTDWSDWGLEFKKNGNSKKTKKK